MIGPKVHRGISEAKARKIVAARDEDTCVRCRRGGPANWDHRLNRSQGGYWSPECGQLLCGSGTTGCHGWRTSHPKEAAAEGWAVPGWGDPLTYPARRYIHDPGMNLYTPIWVLYTAEGSWVQISDADAARRISEGRLYGEAVA